ncbi:hypothetical protein ACJIZ3_020159 [Penstemon smallii]|uniref:Uncharacterized protein n=1 Tax=Penstemon smallii TaxID=265156 RepID=A0ABD3SI48_9LAMI
MIPGTAGVGNGIRRSLLFVLSPWSYHARFKQNPFKSNIVLRQVVENLGPNLLRHFKRPLNRVISIKKNLRFYNWHKTIVLHTNQTFIYPLMSGKRKEKGRCSNF